MTGCCVHGCTNSTAKGFSMRMFPTNRERREQWITSIGMPNWEPNANSRICEAHFAKNMWEKDRCDGKRKLKCNAVPTIFPYHSVNENALSKNCVKIDVINMFIASLTDEGEVKIDHQYQLDFKNIDKQPEDSSSASATVNVKEETDWKKQYEELMCLLRKSESECEKLRDAMKRREELFNRIIKKSYRCSKVLKKRLKRLREENQIYKSKIRLEKIFTEDQIKALANEGMSCQWSDETIKRAIRLRTACGSNGYQEILNQNIPLPSERTLRRKMNLEVELGKKVCDELSKT